MVNQWFPRQSKHIYHRCEAVISTSFSFARLLLLNSCTTENSLDVHATVPSASNAGNYLTGRVAYNNHDLNDATSSFRDALKKNPNENLLLRRSFIAELEAGNLDHAIKLAERALKQKKTSIFMHLVIGLRDAKKGSWDKALGNFTKMESSQVNEILKPLLLGWSYLGKKTFQSSAKSIKLKEKRGFELLVSSTRHSPFKIKKRYLL
ncbi:MAG: hypothetical protein CM15mP62_04490 [Rhodospirillaceae bacterium]|nr:MAG: hypothetical protein CM15mP62_04490 [Rhodospirillaceae bacterium]